MSHTHLLNALLVVVAAPLAAAQGQSNHVLDLRDAVLEGRPSPEASVEFLSLDLADRLVHLPSHDRLPLRLAIEYRVTEPAPVILNSRLGTEYWELTNFTDGTRAKLHTREDIDLREPGTFTARIDTARADLERGQHLARGMQGITNHHYFLIDQPEGEWVNIINAPPFFGDRAVTDDLVFTAADLSQFDLEIAAIESTWEPAGPVRVRVEVEDARGDTFPVVNVPAHLAAGEARVELRTERNWLHQPTGWMVGTLPDTVPDEVTASATVACVLPGGPETRSLNATFPKGQGRVEAPAFSMLPPVPELPRNEAGEVRETRAMWVGTSDASSPEAIEELLDHATEAGINVLVVDIFYRSKLLAKSDLCEPMSAVKEDFDPLAVLCERAHERGIEVHAWYCVSYASEDYPQTHPEWAAVDANGEGIPMVHDLHDPEFRDWFVAMTAEVAENYDIDGTHLDYIRTKSDCYCSQCRAEFQDRFGKPLAEATDAEWTKWNRSAVGDIVRRVAEATRAADPNMVLSAAVFAALEGGARQGQDPGRWANEGWLDVVMPMDYTLSNAKLWETERKFLEILDDDSKLATGICLYQRVDGDKVPRPASLVKEQIQIVRSLGIHGYVLFSEQYIDDEIIAMLRSELSDEPAVPYYR